MNENTSVYIKDYNANFYKVLCNDLQITNFIRNIYNFNLPSYLTPKRLRGVIGGRKINLMKMGNELPKGLLENFLSILDKNKISYTTDIEKQEQSFGIDNLKSVFDNKLKLSRFNKTAGAWEPIHPFDFQFEAVKYCFEDRRCLIESATSSGKSLIIYMVVLLFLMEILKRKSDKKILIVISTVQLVEQLYNDFCEYSHLNNIPIAQITKKISGAYSKVIEDNHKIVISTWQSLVNKDPSYFKDFEYFLTDEVHEADIASIKKIIRNCVNAKSFIGFTGSFGLIDDVLKKVKMLSLIGMYGPVRKIINAKELIGKNLAAKINIEEVKIPVFANGEVLQLNDSCKEMYAARTNGEISEATYEELAMRLKRNLYTAESHCVFEDEAGYEKVVEIVKKNADKNGMLFFTNKKYGQKVVDSFKNLEENPIKTFYIDGDITVNERENIKKILETSYGNLLVASSGTSKKGISINSIHYAILFQPGKSDVTIIQMLGRTMRKSSYCNDVVIYDFSFELYNGPKRLTIGNYLMKQHKERMKIYKAEGHLDDSSKS